MKFGNNFEGDPRMNQLSTSLKDVEGVDVVEEKDEVLHNILNKAEKPTEQLSIDLDDQRPMQDPDGKDLLL